MGTDKDDEIDFAVETEEAPKAVPDDGVGDVWNTLIVDDDEEVHSITRMVLRDFSFLGRRANLVSAFTAAEARQFLDQTPDVALILLDVVMETDDAGLRLVKYIRDELKNLSVRIILRTGQPGQAPEREVILEYDINDHCCPVN